MLHVSKNLSHFSKESSCVVSILENDFFIYSWVKVYELDISCYSVVYFLDCKLDGRIFCFYWSFKILFIISILITLKQQDCRGIWGALSFSHVPDQFRYSFCTLYKLCAKSLVSLLIELSLKNRITVWVSNASNESIASNKEDDSIE